jgi:hypothetical protein
LPDLLDRENVLASQACLFVIGRLVIGDINASEDGAAWWQPGGVYQEGNVYYLTQNHRYGGTEKRISGTSNQQRENGPSRTITDVQLAIDAKQRDRRFERVELPQTPKTFLSRGLRAFPQDVPVYDGRPIVGPSCIGRQNVEASGHFFQHHRSAVVWPGIAELEAGSDASFSTR